MTPFRRGVLAILMGLVPWSGLENWPIEVRFAEGAAHGLLLVPLCERRDGTTRYGLPRLQA
jgi:hypothetical protein